MVKKKTAEAADPAAAEVVETPQPKVADILTLEELDELEGMIASLRMMKRHYDSFKEGKVKVRHPVTDEEVDLDVPAEHVEKYTAQVEELSNKVREKAQKLGLLPEVEV